MNIYAELQKLSGWINSPIDESSAFAMQTALNIVQSGNDYSEDLGLFEKRLGYSDRSVRDYLKMAEEYTTEALNK